MRPGGAATGIEADWAAPPAPPRWVRQALGSPTGRGVRVGIIDSGYDRTIPDPRVLPGVSFVDPSDDFALGRGDDDHDRLGHGTACADLVLRIAPEAEVVPIRVFGNQLETSPSILHAALVWAVEQKLPLVNVSLGTMLEGTLHPLYAVCEKGRRNGTVFVAAGHNARTWSYPAIFENVIGVAADRFSSPFEYRYRPDDAMECEAWGVEQPVLWLGGDRVIKNGTSFAAPNITGIVALMLERHPGATLEDVRALLQKFALRERGRPRRLRPAHERMRPVAWSEMARLEAQGLGRRVQASPQRETFVLSASHPRAKTLTDRPGADGFIRADHGGLLFRAPSEALRKALPPELAARAVAGSAKKGLEFRWTELQPVDVRRLFDVVAALARGGAPGGVVRVGEAQVRLRELLEAAARGEEVLIAGDDGATFRLVHTGAARPVVPPRGGAGLAPQPPAPPTDEVPQPANGPKPSVGEAPPPAPVKPRARRRTPARK